MADSYIYHLVEEPLWKAAPADGYRPPTYDADGFIHATKEAELLIPIANTFYKDVKSDFLCLRIDTKLLKSEVKYESAATVNNKEVPEDFGKRDEDNETAAGSSLQCPHVYGTLNAEAVVAELQVTRDNDGTFVSIEGLSHAQAPLCSLGCRA